MHNLSKGSAIFLFPHQDDEVGIFQQILEEQKFGNKIFCLYFTRSLDNRKNSIRELESLNVLLSYGVERNNVLFIGRLLCIEDKNLFKNAPKAKAWLEQWLLTHNNISNIYVPAWEGGHPDHDCLNAIISTISTQNKLINKVWQFPLYNANRCAPYFYRILSTIDENGPITTISINLKNRLRFIKSCLMYPSQWSSWIGLFPFFLFNYLILGKQTIQPIQVKRLNYRPHAGNLYYEVRNFGSWEDVYRVVKLLTKSNT